ncbi:MAG TPA: proline racemase family protein [Euzebya sp.]|nr:proline racemase family protein [Euzebya sp.]
MSAGPLQVSTVDYHTGGEPFRIVSGGIPPLQGATVGQRRRWAADNLEAVRRLLVDEPRGHADMYGGFVTPADDDGADLGVVFFHNAGYSTACGHGTIALATWAVDSGVVAVSGPGSHDMVIDVPSGRLPVTVEVDDHGRVTGVAFRNVPSYVAVAEVDVEVAGRRVDVDIAFGGAFYAILPAADVGMSIEPAQLPAIIGVCRAIKDHLNATAPPQHPEDPRLAGVYGVILVEDLPDTDGADLVQRNVTVFADGEVDRSATGSGTSARLALLHAQGRLPVGGTLENRSIVDSVMTGRILGPTEVVGIPAVDTEVAGTAFRTGIHHFTLDLRDPLGTGFLLR